MSTMPLDKVHAINYTFSCRNITKRWITNLWVSSHQWFLLLYLQACTACPKSSHGKWLGRVFYFYFVSPMGKHLLGVCRKHCKYTAPVTSPTTLWESAGFPILELEFLGALSWSGLLSSKAQPVCQPRAFALQWTPYTMPKRTQLFQRNTTKETFAPTPAPSLWLDLLYAKLSRKDSKLNSEALWKPDTLITQHYSKGWKVIATWYSMKVLWNQAMCNSTFF